MDVKRPGCLLLNYAEGITSYKRQEMHASVFYIGSQFNRKRFADKDLKIYRPNVSKNWIILVDGEDKVLLNIYSMTLNFEMLVNFNF